MGDKGQGVGDTTQSQLNAFVSTLPKLLETYNSQVAPTAKAQLEADQSVAPGYSQLQYDLYNKYGPEFAKTGSEIDRASQLAAAETEKQIAGSTGGDLVTLADKYQRQIDPEFYKTRELVSKGYSDLIGGQDPNQLTAGEIEAQQRGLARSPGYFTPAANSTLANAGVFGDKLQAKKDAFGRSLATASAGLSGLKSGYNAFEVATHRPLTSNTGVGQYQAPATGTGANTWGTGQDWLGNIGQASNIAQQKKKSLLENVGGWADIGAKTVGSAATAAAI